MFVGGGPDPSANGDIATIAVHTGQDPYGHSFRKAYAGYNDNILVPFRTFLHSVYRKSN